MGTIFAKLLLASNVLRDTPEGIQWVCSLGAYATCAYFGMMLAIRSNRDEFSIIIPYVRFRQSAAQDAPLIIDSNIVIDATAFQTSARRDSQQFPGRPAVHSRSSFSDWRIPRIPYKRDRGRRALERLQHMQADPEQLSIADA